MAITTEKSGAELQVEEILNRAKGELKGRLYIYERYKSELIEVCESSAQLGRATIDLAKILRV